MNGALALQLSTAAALGSALFVVLRKVCQEQISDKYGAMEFVFLSLFFILNLSQNWFRLIPLDLGALIFLSSTAFVAMGIYYSIHLTNYSRARRKALQDLALLRWHCEQLEAKRNDGLNTVSHE